jgi:GNAT superfamily N-acetyltransferase
MKASNIDFRTATEEGLDGIVELWMESSIYRQSIDSRLAVRPDAKKHVRAFYSLLMTSDSAYFAIAVSSGEQIGYICVQIQECPPIHFEKESGFVDVLFLMPNYRLQRVGSTLFQMALKWLKEHGISGVRLAVSPYNALGLEF